MSLVASYDAVVTRRLGGFSNVMGGVVREVGGYALDEALAGSMFGGDAAVPCCQ